MNILRIFGILEFPWITILIWGAIGLAGGLLGKWVYWQDAPSQVMANLLFGLAGAGSGMFLGLCYAVIWAVANRPQL